MAVPHDWNGDLVVHAHGGPDLGDASDPARSLEDLDRWSVMVREGYAWVGSAYRRGGYGTRMAVADTESARRSFEERSASRARPRARPVVGRRRRGQARRGPPDVVRRRAAHQRRAGRRLARLRLPGRPARGLPVLLRQPPAPDRAAVPALDGAARGLDDDLGRPARAAPGVHRLPVRAGRPHGAAAAQPRRHPRRHRVPERTLESHLRFATFTFRDIVHHRLGGRNPFSNRGVRYSGSHDDKALNPGVERFAADPSARATCPGTATSPAR